MKGLLEPAKWGFLQLTGQNSMMAVVQASESKTAAAIETSGQAWTIWRRVRSFIATSSVYIGKVSSGSRIMSGPL